jgi:hypothetical protein
MRELVGALAALAIVTVAGCTYYETAPGVYQTSAPSKFDRAWSAALGAFDDQGVPVTYRDRDSGVIQGSRDGINVTATVRTQADGSVRVQFDTSGATNRDPELIHRIDRAYERFMGR